MRRRLTSGRMAPEILGKIKDRVSVLHHDSHGHIDPAECQKEKDFVSDFSAVERPISPAHIAEDPRNKQLGVQSQNLRVQDFELIKTLGTGLSALSSGRLLDAARKKLRSYTRHIREGLAV